MANERGWKATVKMLQENIRSLQAQRDRAVAVCEALKDVRSTLTDTDVEWMMPDVLKAHDLYLAGEKEKDDVRDTAKG